MVGTYWRALFLAKNLVKEGHDVLLVASSREHALSACRKITDGVPVCLLPRVTFGENSLLYSLSDVSTVFMQAFANCVLEVASDFDILHSFDVMGPHNAVPTLLSWILRVLRVHSRRIFVDWDDWWGRGGMFGRRLFGLHGEMSLDPLVAPVVTFLEETVPRYANAVTVVNDTLRRRASSVGVESDNVFVIPNGANEDVIKPLDIQDAKEKLGLPRESIVYGHFGHLDIESFKLLLSAHKKVVRYFPNALLLLYRLSDDLLVQLSKDFFRSLKSSNVVFVGRQPYDKYTLYLGASDVFLLPLHDNLFNRARWPLRLGDYLAAGRPTVATALPEIEKVVRDCGLLARPGDAEDFAVKMLEIAGDPDVREQMGERARELAETKYSWRVHAKELENIYGRYLD